VPERMNSCDKENMISQLVKVQAQVKVTPLVKHGRPKVYCIDSCVRQQTDCYGPAHCDDVYDDSYDFCCGCDWDDFPSCCEPTKAYGFRSDCGRDEDYDFTLTQVICIEIPISFDAEVDIKKGIACCSPPDVNPDCGQVLVRDENKRDPICILMNNKVQF